MQRDKRSGFIKANNRPSEYDSIDLLYQKYVLKETPPAQDQPIDVDHIRRQIEAQSQFMRQLQTKRKQLFSELGLQAHAQSQAQEHSREDPEFSEFSARDADDLLHRSSNTEFDTFDVRRKQDPDQFSAFQIPVQPQPLVKKTVPYPPKIKTANYFQNPPQLKALPQHKPKASENNPLRTLNTQHSSKETKSARLRQIDKEVQLYQLKIRRLLEERRSLQEQLEDRPQRKPAASQELPLQQARVFSPPRPEEKTESSLDDIQPLRISTLHEEQANSQAISQAISQANNLNHLERAGRMEPTGRLQNESELDFEQSNQLISTYSAKQFFHVPIRVTPKAQALTPTLPKRQAIQQVHRADPPKVKPVPKEPVSLSQAFKERCHNMVSRLEKRQQKEDSSYNSVQQQESIKESRSSGPGKQWAPPRPSLPLAPKYIDSPRGSVHVAKEGKPRSSSQHSQASREYSRRSNQEDRERGRQEKLQLRQRIKEFDRKNRLRSKGQ